MLYGSGTRYRTGYTGSASFLECKRGTYKLVLLCLYVQMASTACYLLVKRYTKKQSEVLCTAYVQCNSTPYRKREARISMSAVRAWPEDEQMRGVE